MGPNVSTLWFNIMIMTVVQIRENWHKCAHLGLYSKYVGHYLITNVGFMTTSFRKNNKVWHHGKKKKLPSHCAKL